jgi:hypothetical protein
VPPTPIRQLLATVSGRISSPDRFCLYLVLASTPLLAISGEVFGVVSLRTASNFFLFPLLALVAVLVAVRPDGIDRTAAAGFAWGLVACAGYDCFRLPTVYFFHLWGDFFGTVGGWATGTSSDYLAGYLWRYLGDGAGIGIVVFTLAAAIGISSWPRRHVVGLTIAFAVFPVWTRLVLTDGLAPKGRALFPLTTTTLTLSLAGHLIYGAILGYGLWASQNRQERGLSRARPAPAQISPRPAPTQGWPRYVPTAGTAARPGEPELAGHQAAAAPGHQPPSPANPGRNDSASRSNRASHDVAVG